MRAASTLVVLACGAVALAQAAPQFNEENLVKRLLDEDPAVPSIAPTFVPTSTPTSVPTSTPTSVPTTNSTTPPGDNTTSVPTSTPTSVPTSMPTSVPTSTSPPTSVPTPAPTSSVDNATPAPTPAPTGMAGFPTYAPTQVPAEHNYAEEGAICEALGAALATPIECSATGVTLDSLVVGAGHVATYTNRYNESAAAVWVRVDTAVQLSATAAVRGDVLDLTPELSIALSGEVQVVDHQTDVPVCDGGAVQFGFASMGAQNALEGKAMYDACNDLLDPASASTGGCAAARLAGTYGKPDDSELLAILITADEPFSELGLTVMCKPKLHNSPAPTPAPTTYSRVEEFRYGTAALVAGVICFVLCCMYRAGREADALAAASKKESDAQAAAEKEATRLRMERMAGGGGGGGGLEESKSSGGYGDDLGGVGLTVGDLSKLSKQRQPASSSFTLEDDADSDDAFSSAMGGSTVEMEMAPVRSKPSPKRRGSKGGLGAIKLAPPSKDTTANSRSSFSLAPPRQSGGAGAAKTQDVAVDVFASPNASLPSSGGEVDLLSL